MLGRIAFIAIPLLLIYFALRTFAPENLDSLLSMLPDNLFQALLVSTLPTIIVLALLFVVSGAKNDNFRQAFQFIIILRWTLHAKSRRQVSALKSYFDESYDQLMTHMEETSLEVNRAIARSIVEWLKNQSDSYRRAEETLAELRKVISARSDLFDQYIRVVNERLDKIPEELRDTADEIKKNAIEEHMKRIRNAAKSVEQVKSKVQNIVEIAEQSS